MNDVENVMMHTRSEESLREEMISVQGQIDGLLSEKELLNAELEVAKAKYKKALLVHSTRVKDVDRWIKESTEHRNKLFKELEGIKSEK